jgi:hypothetical protein
VGIGIPHVKKFPCRVPEVLCHPVIHLKRHFLALAEFFQDQENSMHRDSTTEKECGVEIVRECGKVEEEKTERNKLHGDGRRVL